MAVNQQDIENGEKDYADGFNETQAKKPEQSEDEAFGLNIDGAPGADSSGEEGDNSSTTDDQGNAPADGNAPAAMLIVATPSGKPEGEDPATSAHEAADSKSQGSNEEDSESDADKAKETQRLKSWEGRLKKLEAELKAKAASTGDTTEQVAEESLEDVADQAKAEGKTDLAQAAGDAAEKVEDGEMTVEQAEQMLTEDFGDDFIKMMLLIVRKYSKQSASEEIDEVKKKTDDIINHITDKEKKAHFQAIAAAFPDFQEINASPDFQAWIAEDPKRQEIAAKGSADEIIQMLTEFKAGQGEQPDAQANSDESANGDQPAAGMEPAGNPEQGANEDELDAAEGVSSSGGLTLPEEPGSSDDYAGAWNDFERKDRTK